jgi:hypothetical protein
LPVSQTLNISDSQTFNASALDTVIDFAGTSGNDFGTVVGTGSGTASLFSGFSPYVGLGTYAVSVNATGSSSASGAGNLINQVNTQGKATLQVTYN